MQLFGFGKNWPSYSQIGTFTECPCAMKKIKKIFLIKKFKFRNNAHFLSITGPKHFLIRFGAPFKQAIRHFPLIH